MQTININFSRIAKIGDRLREFNFRKLPGFEDHYHVDVTDDRGVRHMFTISKNKQGWTLNASNLPDWLNNADKSIGQMIETYSFGKKAV